MLVWFLLALVAAIANSWSQVVQKWAIFLSRYSKITIAFVSTATAALILFVVSYFIIGVPQIDERFWVAVLVTGILNTLALPMMLKAYELGEFSSVYSMILMTPVFLLIASPIVLGEMPSPIGIFGVLLTVLGLWVITRTNHEHTPVPNFAKGNLLGLAVAFIWSISVNFDKLAAIYSDQFFAPAATMAITAAGCAIYLFATRRALIIKTSYSLAINNNHRFAVPKIFILLLLGALMALGGILHNSALLAGFASYTIAIKRIGVLFGVFWGWLFFKEKHLFRKALGATIAIAGVVAILFTN